MNNLQQLKQLFQGQRYRGLALATIVLAILAITQVNHLQPPVSTCQLFSGNLKGSDVERIQLALGSAGLNDFSVENGRILVPRAHRAKYLQAVSTHNAVPTRLREQVADTDSISMFMTHSQQKLIAAEKKKKQVREMVARLPFVEQVWFEMDVADTSNAFESAQRTAVISIEPAENVTLDATQIDTVKRMIQGAVAGMKADQIQVIDIQSGYAHSAGRNPNQTASVQGLPALEQQNYFENRIRRSLVGLDGVDVNVKVDVVKIPAPNVSPPVQKIPEANRITSLMPVTNGYASIYDNAGNEPKVIQASFAKPQPTFATRVAVDVAVPQALVESYAGHSLNDSDAFVESATLGDSLAKPRIGSNRKSGSRNLEKAFAKVRADINNRIQPLLPSSSPVVGPSPVNIRLIRSASISPVGWIEQVKPLLSKYWPSLAVLSIGILLITSMTRNDRKHQQLLEETNDSNADILSINSTLDGQVENPDAVSDGERRARIDAERKLNEMIEQDPDNAQKVIEKWIRDAA